MKKKLLRDSHDNFVTQSLFITSPPPKVLNKVKSTMKLKLNYYGIIINIDMYDVYSIIKVWTKHSELR
jgi:hypothetical protein